MKKNLLILSTLILSILLFTSCGEKTTNDIYGSSDDTDITNTNDASTDNTTMAEPNTDEVIEIVPIQIGTLAGPTGMGLIQIIDDKSGAYESNIYTAPDQIVPKIISGEVDIASIPSNLASVLYNKTEGAISILSVNATGVLHIVENGDTISSIADLKGKTIYATGQGASPEYVLTYLLEENGLVVGEDVEIEFLAQHSDLANMVVAGDVEIALLPEPFVSITTAKNSDINIQIDLNQEWQAIYGEDMVIPISATIARNTFIEEQPEKVAAFIEAHKASVDFVNASSEDASVLIAEYSIIPSAEIAKSAIPKSNIGYTEGSDAKAILEQYYDVLFNSNPQSVGGTIPDESFYYIP